MNCNTIPVIDLENVGTQNDGLDSMTNISKEIQKALHEVGFMYLRNHKISQNVISDAFEASKAFFDLDENAKQRYRKIADQANHGWIQAGQELLHPNSVFEIREAYDFTSEVLCGIEEVPTFAHTMNIFKKECEKFMKVLLPLISLSLNLPKNFFTGKCKHLDDDSIGNECDLRIIHYPVVPPRETIPKDTVRCAEHTDYEMLTLLFQDAVGGLQVKNSKGEWISATPIPNTILVNTGDLLERWTGGYYTATKHRVIIPEAEIKQRMPRYSFAYFFAPDNDTNVQALDLQVLSGKSVHEKYVTPITAYKHIMNRVKEAYQY